VVNGSKYLILGGVECGIVGSHLVWLEVASGLVLNTEPERSCTVIGWGDEKPSPLAVAVLSSTVIQGFELDNYQSGAPLLSNSILLPAADVAKTYSGSELLLA
jgi:aconitate decarboxylase